MPLNKKQLGRIAICRTIDEIHAVASKADAIHEGRVDLRGMAIRLHLNKEDLGRLSLERANLSGSELTDCCARGVSFRGCRFGNVRITNKDATSGTYENADFSETTITDSYFGPRTLTLRGCQFVNATIGQTTFMLADLAGASFAGATLKRVYLRNADLRGVSFVRATLHSVCFERATLEDADFDQVTMRRMDDWGEPDYSGARIADEIRYRYTIVAQPVAAVASAINRLDLSPSEQAASQAFLNSVGDFAEAAPEAMLRYDDYDHLMSFGLFIRIVKAAKSGG